MQAHNIEDEKVYEVLVKTRESDLSRISALDSTTFTIKGWAITLVTALVGLALQQKSRGFLFVGMIIAALFAFVDFSYREVQLSHVDRVIKIERYLATKYLNNIEELKYLFKSSDSNRERNFNRDYLISVFLVYLILEIMLAILSFFALVEQ